MKLAIATVFAAASAEKKVKKYPFNVKTRSIQIDHFHPAIDQF